jgi:hypothetical protein
MTCIDRNRVILALGIAALVAALVPVLALAGGRPPDLLASSDGEIRVRVQRGIADASHHLYLQVDRAASGPGWDEDYDLGILAGTNPVIDTGVQVRAGDRINVKAAVTFAGRSLALAYDADRDARPGEPRARIVDHDTRGTRRYCGGGTEGPVDVTGLFTSSVELISLSCWEDYEDWDYNDFVVAVDYTPGSIPPTATATSTGAAPATSTPTPCATAAATSTPTLTPRASADCVCRAASRQVPAVVVMDALVQPERYFGWMVLLDPNKPPSPANPPRTCLSLHRIGLRYDPMWNRPEWRVGCP